MAEAAQSPRAGYPVVCVTACDPKNPLFEEVRALCEDERIDNDKTEYRYEILVFFNSFLNFLIFKTFYLTFKFSAGKYRHQPVPRERRIQ